LAVRGMVRILRRRVPYTSVYRNCPSSQAPAATRPAPASARPAAGCTAQERKGRAAPRGDKPERETDVEGWLKRFTRE
jgi:hypothetical protein